MGKDAKDIPLTERSSCRIACATSHCTGIIPGWNISQSVNKTNILYTITVIKHGFGMKERGSHPFPMLYIFLFCVLFFSSTNILLLKSENKGFECTFTIIGKNKLCLARKMFLKCKALNLSGT